MRIQERLNKFCNRLNLDLVPLSHVESEAEFIHFNAEAWSTWKYSFRMSDKKYIRESTALNGRGISESELVKRIIREQIEWKRFKDSYNKALNDANGNHRRVVILNRREGLILVVPEHVANASHKTHFFQVWCGDAEHAFTWEAFDASEAVSLTRVYYGAKCIKKIDVILKTKWEKQHQEKTKARK